MDHTDFLSAKYKIGKRDQHGNPLRIREIQWLNFGCGEDSDGQMVHHPDKVWFQHSLSTKELCKKVRMTTSAQVNLQPSILYESPFPLNPNKVKYLQKLARPHLRARTRVLHELKSSAAIEDSDDDE